MEDIRKSIVLQKENADALEHKCDFYKIKDPVYNFYHVHVL